MKRKRIKYLSLEEKIFRLKATLAKELAIEESKSFKKAFDELQFKRDMRKLHNQ
jgi:hypothetical protein